MAAEAVLGEEVEGSTKPICHVAQGVVGSVADEPALVLLDPMVMACVGLWQFRDGTPSKEEARGRRKSKREPQPIPLGDECELVGAAVPSETQSDDVGADWIGGESLRVCVAVKLLKSFIKAARPGERLEQRGKRRYCGRPRALHDGPVSLGGQFKADH